MFIKTSKFINILPLIDKVYHTCKTCKQYKKPSHRLVVGLTHYSPVLLFNNPWKHQKTFRFSDVFRGKRKATPGCNGLSKASDFKNTVAMDLHQLGSILWYFHIIEKFTRFSNAVIVYTKSSKIIAEKFLQMWISIFWPPNQIFSNNEGEFVWQSYVDLCENFNY